MRLTNLALNVTEQSGACLLSVELATGSLFWKRTERRPICRQRPGYWFFLDTGEFPRSKEIAGLERDFAALKR